MVERRVERNLDGAKNIRKKALASPLQQEVYALPQDPEAQLQDQILTGDAQIQRRHHLINQNLLIASKAIALAGEPPFLSEEQKGPLRDKQKIALDRWRLALPDNTPPAKVLDASDEF